MTGGECKSHPARHVSRKGAIVPEIWVNSFRVNWVNLGWARLADKTLDILRALLVVLKLEFAIN